MPGILDSMVWYEWLGMASIVLVYCVFTYRIGRADV